MYDVMILGGGPAGRTAALYCARSALRCIVLEGTPGGQMALTQHVDNIPDFLMRTALRWLRKCGNRRSVRVRSS